MDTPTTEEENATRTEEQTTSATNRRDKVNEVRDEMIQTLLDYIEKNPTDWQSGWNDIAAGAPYNGKTTTAYRGINAVYLAVVGKNCGYTDTRWVTYNQAKELGASVKKGEKSSSVIFYELYDRATKKEFDRRTVNGMSEEEKSSYLKENVYAVMKYTRVFNAEQCQNFPEREQIAMTEEERTKQNAAIETIIANSAAPVLYDGGSRAYYAPGEDRIHLPAISAFDTKQDYYATALHEIAHSTGHESRLNRDLSGGFGSESYAKEELRAELACVFMQIEQGISLDGKHIENHAAYMNAWLEAARNDKSVFFKAAADAQRIADYVAANYMHAAASEVEEEKTPQEQTEREEGKEENAVDAVPVFNRELPFAAQVDAVLGNKLPKGESVMVRKETPFILRQVGFKNLPMLTSQRHIIDALQPKNADNPHMHGLSTEIINGLPEYLESPAMIMDSLTRKDSVIVVTDKTDGDGLPIIMSVAADGNGMYNHIDIESNYITSFYGKENFDRFLERNIEEKTVLYWDKEKSLSLLDSMRLQLPQALTNLDSDTIIRKTNAFVNRTDEKSKDQIINLSAEESAGLQRGFEILDNVKTYDKFFASTSELLRRYAQIKRENPSEIVFYRVGGDFYEVFGEDAEKAAEELELTLMGREARGLDERVPMVAVPYHAIDEYASKLAEKGVNVAITDGTDIRHIKSNTTQDMAQMSQNKPVEAQERKREWLSIDLPEGAVGNRYGENTMIKMPKGEYSYFAFYVPNGTLQEAEGKTQLRIASDMTYRLNNDGRQVELTGQELCDSFGGMQIGKEPVRVAPSRAYAKTYEALEQNVPEEMKALPNWCVYRTWQREDREKKGKVLKSAVTGEGASSKNPMDWTDFNTALEYAKKNGFAGVAFLLEKKNGITCIDLDECVLNAETGEMKERAATLISGLQGTYMERSASGNGVHIFLKDDILKGGSYRSTSVDGQKGDLEVYDDKRIISMTGDMFSETNALTRAGSASTVYLRNELGENHRQNAPERPQAQESRTVGGIAFNDGELIAWIRGSKKGREFDDLYSGKGVSGNKSNDDAKLAHMLLYFSGGNKEQTFRIMRESGAYRADKPDSYYKTTIEKMDAILGGGYAKRPNYHADGTVKTNGTRRGNAR